MSRRKQGQGWPCSDSSPAMTCRLSKRKSREANPFGRADSSHPGGDESERMRDDRPETSGKSPPHAVGLVREPSRAEVMTSVGVCGPR